MKISEMVRRGKSEVYKIFVDEKFYCLLTAEVIIKNKLKTGQDIDEQTFLEMKKQSDKLLSRDIALSYIEKGMKTQKQVADNLRQKGIDESAILDAISFLKSYNYIDDKTYAKQYVLTKKGKGKSYLKNALLQKGINKSVIDEVLDSYQIDEDELLLLTKKYVKNKTMDNKLKQKAYRHILSKGYSFDEAKKAVEKVFGEQNDWDWCVGNKANKKPSKRWKKIK